MILRLPPSSEVRGRAANPPSGTGPAGFLPTVSASSYAFSAAVFCAASVVTLCVFLVLYVW